MAYQPLLLIELNEINFDFVRDYVRQGKLPNLGRLIATHGISETMSEEQYEHIEPWIQWVTAHTGLTFQQHGVYRLGDIAKFDLPQIWEQLEDSGLKVGAVSPINGKNRTRSASFFIPDPWTATSVTASQLTSKMYRAICQAVNENAQSKLRLNSVLWLLLGALINARVKNYRSYFRLALGSRRRPWYKAMFLDLLLTDVFLTNLHSKRPDFATLFLNAGAHIQHHYLFSSTVYSGRERNPAWYVSPEADPVLDIFELYDELIGQVLNTFKGARVMLATGLHQNPHSENTFYWRLKNHPEFLKKIGVPFVSVEPRMSRDFLITCASMEQARKAERLLSLAAAVDDVPLFEVDNRGVDLFVMLAYPRDVDEQFTFKVDGRLYLGFRDDIAFVAIKNGEHNGIGYFLDTGVSAIDCPRRFPLAELPQLIKQAAGISRQAIPGREQTIAINL